MSDARLRLTAAIGLVVGAVLGMAGTFAPSASLRGLSWGLGGIALVVAAALLTIHHVHRGNDLAAAGFLVFAVGEGLILSGAAMDLAASAPSTRARLTFTPSLAASMKACLSAAESLSNEALFIRKIAGE